VSDESESADGVVRGPLLDAVVLLAALALPWVLTSEPWLRVGLATLGGIAWVAVVRPGWRGLLHFYGTVVLGLALAGLVGMAVLG
jgi:hypothetical protein